MPTNERHSKTEFDIFEALVVSDDDVIGLLAFALYKRSEMSFVIRYTNEYGIVPDESVLQTFRADYYHGLKLNTRKQAQQMAMSIDHIEKILERTGEIAQTLQTLQSTVGGIHTKVNEKKTGFFSKK